MTTRELVAGAAVQTDRVDWARRGSPNYAGIQLLALEVTNDDLDGAADSLDHWAASMSGMVVEVQHVLRRAKRVIYARVA